VALPQKGEFIMTNKLTLWDIVETELLAKLPPRKINRIENNTEIVDEDYELGFNDCLSSIQKIINEACK
jgi:hypothetical protein